MDYLCSMVSVFCAAPLCVNDGDDAVLDGVLDRLNVTARALNHKDPWAILREALAIMNDILVSVAAEPRLKQIETPLAYGVELYTERSLSRLICKHCLP